MTRWGFAFDFFSFGGFLAAEHFRKVPKKNEGFLEQKFTQVLRCVFFFGGIKEELASLKLTNRS